MTDTLTHLINGVTASSEASFVSNVVTARSSSPASVLERSAGAPLVVV